MNLDMIFKVFKHFYPDLTPKQVFKAYKGFVIVAPNVENGVDYNAPLYFVNDRCTSAIPYRIDDPKAFDIFESDPLWEE